jgi:hypothetical protein
MALIDFLELQSFLGVSKPEMNGVLMGCMFRASAWFESITARTFDAVEHTETQIGTGSDCIVPQQYPVISVASLSINGETVPAAAAATDPGYSLIGNVIYLHGCRAHEGALVVIRYTAGYVDVPADVSGCVLRLAARDYQSRLSTPGSGDVSFNYSFLPVEMQAVIDAHKRVI